MLLLVCAQAGVLALSCPDEVHLASTSHLAGNPAYVANNNARFHLAAKSSTKNTVTPLTNAIDFLVASVARPNFLAGGVGQLRTQVRGDEPLQTQFIAAFSTKGITPLL